MPCQWICSAFCRHDIFVADKVFLIKKVVHVMKRQSIQNHAILQEPYNICRTPFVKGGKIRLLEVPPELETVLEPPSDEGACNDSTVSLKQLFDVVEVGVCCILHPQRQQKHLLFNTQMHAYIMGFDVGLMLDVWIGEAIFVLVLLDDGGGKFLTGFCFLGYRGNRDIHLVQLLHKLQKHNPKLHLSPQFVLLTTAIDATILVGTNDSLILVGRHEKKPLYGNVDPARGPRVVHRWL
jgi:hypothetical protein